MSGPSTITGGLLIALLAAAAMPRVVTASGALVASTPIVDGSGVRIVSASGALVGSVTPVMSGSGVDIMQASGALVAPTPPTIAGVATFFVQGGDLIAPSPPVMSGQSYVIRIADGDLVAPTPPVMTGDAIRLRILFSDGALVAPTPPVMDGYADLVFRASGALVAPTPPVMEGAASIVMVASGALTASVTPIVDGVGTNTTGDTLEYEPFSSIFVIPAGAYQARVIFYTDSSFAGVVQIDSCIGEQIVRNEDIDVLGTTNIDVILDDITLNTNAIAVLISQVNIIDGIVTAHSAAIISINATLTTHGGDITANASAITTLSGTVTSQGATITANSAAITSINSSITSINGSLSTQAAAISSLSATVTTQGSTLTSTATAVTALSSRVTTNGTGANLLGSDSATEVSSTSATVKTYNGFDISSSPTDISGLAGSVVSMYVETKSSSGSAASGLSLSFYTSGLSLISTHNTNAVNSTSYGVAQLSNITVPSNAKYINLAAIRTGGSQTTFFKNARLVNSNLITATAVETSNTNILVVDGRVVTIESQWGVTVDVNGRVTGSIQLDATDSMSTFAVIADKFVVYNGTTDEEVFTVTGGDVYINSEKVTTDSIVPDGVSSTDAVTLGSNTSLANNQSLTEIFDLTVSADATDKPQLFIANIVVDMSSIDGAGTEILVQVTRYTASGTLNQAIIGATGVGVAYATWGTIYTTFDGLITVSFVDTPDGGTDSRRYKFFVGIEDSSTGTALAGASFICTGLAR